MGRDRIRSLIGKRRAWQRLPRRRRGALWSFKQPPRDEDEARVTLGFAEYVRSGLGHLEWALAGVAAWVGGTVLHATVGTFSWETSVAGLVPWVIVWTLVGVPLRRSRGTALAQRAHARSARA